MKKKTVLITGGAGFIGSHLCKYLTKDYKVICLDNLVTGSLKNIKNIEVEFMDHDVCNPIDIKGNIDSIFHLASPASPVDYLRLPILTLRTGAVGTYNVLELAKLKGAKMLLSSTSEVYGDPLEHPQTEDYYGNVNPVGPRGVYDEAKRFGEALMMAYSRQRLVHTRIARLFNTYGQNMRADDGRAIPGFINQALHGKDITIFGKGKQTRSFCYIDDMVKALYRLSVVNYHYPVNIGNPDEWNIIDLANKIKVLVSSNSKIVFMPLPQDDPKVRMPDITKAKLLLGWKPEYDLHSGLVRTIDWFKNER